MTLTTDGRKDMTHTYKTNDPKGWGGDPRRGAALGRPSMHSLPTLSVTIHITRKQLDNGGYDENGTYFGIGEPLFWVHTEDGEIDYMIRALTLERARDKVHDKYPNAKISGDRYNVSLDTELLTQLLKSEVESLDGNEDAELNEEILKAAIDFETAVLQTLEIWVANNLKQIKVEENGYEPDSSVPDSPSTVELVVLDLSDLGGGAGYLYYMEADGSGVGTWDGRWDHVFKSRTAIDDLSKVMKLVTRGSFEKLRNALMDAAGYEGE